MPHADGLLRERRRSDAFENSLPEAGFIKSRSRARSGAAGPMDSGHLEQHVKNDRLSGSTSHLSARRGSKVFAPSGFDDIARVLEEHEPQQQHKRQTACTGANNSWLRHEARVLVELDNLQTEGAKATEEMTREEEELRRRRDEEQQELSRRQQKEQEDLKKLQAEAAEMADALKRDLKEHRNIFLQDRSRQQQPQPQPQQPQKPKPRRQPRDAEEKNSCKAPDAEEPQMADAARLAEEARRDLAAGEAQAAAAAAAAAKALMQEAEQHRQRVAQAAEAEKTARRNLAEDNAAALRGAEQWRQHSEEQRLHAQHADEAMGEREQRREEEARREKEVRRTGAATNVEEKDRERADEVRRRAEDASRDLEASRRAEGDWQTKRRLDEQLPPAEKIVVERSVPLEVVFTGGPVDVPIMRFTCCQLCQGSGVASGWHPVSCPLCTGVGATMCFVQVGDAIVEQSASCHGCDGRGVVMPSAAYCLGCSGKQVVEEEVAVRFELPPGLLVGEQFTAAGAGHSLPGFAKGDVVLVCGSPPLEPFGNDTGFVREGDNLLAERRIPLQAALCGGTLEIPFFCGRSVLVMLPRGEVISPGSMKCVRGEGLPNRHNPHLRGDLILHFSVDFPARLSEEAVACIDAALSAHTPMSEPRPRSKSPMSDSEALWADFGKKRSQRHRQGLRKDAD